MTPGDFSKTFGLLHFTPEPQAELSAKWTPKNYLMYHSSHGRGTYTNGKGETRLGLCGWGGGEGWCAASWEIGLL